MSLSSLIVQREVATIRQVEEALARQVIYGGDLVTNLLEVTPADEAKLTLLLAESMGIRAAPVGELPPPIDRVRALVPPEMAAHRAMAPLGVESDKLVLAVAEPLPPSVEEELSFALGMRLDLRAAPMVRVREVLTRAYGLPLERRMERLLQRLEGKPVASGSMPPLFGNPQQVAEPPRPPSAPPFKMSPAFGVVRQSQIPTASRKITSAGFPQVRAPKLDDGWEPSQAPPLEPVPVPAPLSAPVPLPVPEMTPPPPHADVAPPVSKAPSTAPEARRQSQPPTSSKRGSARPPQLMQRDVTPAPRPVRRRRGPLTTETANRELEEAPDRDALLDLFFEFSRQFFDYSALFLLHGDIAEGRDAFGDGASRERVVGIGVPMDLPSLLASARDKKKPVTGRPSNDGLDGVLLNNLQRMPKTPVVVVPVVVRGRPVALLLGDFGDGGLDPGSVGEVASFAITVGRAFEKLIVRRKLSGFIAGTRGSTAGRVDPLVAASLVSKAKLPPAPPPPPPVAEPQPSTEPETSPLSASPLAESVEAPPVVEPPELAHAVVDESVAPRDVNGVVGEAADEPAPAASDAERVVETLAAAPEVDGERRIPSAFPPPPAVLVAVRRPTGPPIPREEPPDSVPRRGLEAKAHEADEVDEEGATSGPSIEAATVDDEAARELLEAIGRESGERYEEESSAGPASHSVAIPPHKPPSSRAADARGPLPSVIVDMIEEMGALVDRLASHGADEVAEAELLRQGAHAMPAIMMRFPGPILVDRGRLAAEGTPRASECGPILRLVAGQRKVALPFVLQKLEHPDHEQRYWATLLLAELQYPEAVPALVGRIFDDQARIRRAARVAATAIGRRSPKLVIDELERRIEHATPEQFALAVDALGELREPEVVPVLVRLLGAHADKGETDALGQVVRRALGVVTRQDFGADVRRWDAWWQANSGRNRVEWLVDALDHEVSENRRAAGEELRALTKEYFGYAHDLPPRERQRAQQRYKDWWATEGKARFRRRG